MESVSITNRVVNSNPTQAGCNRYKEKFEYTKGAIKPYIEEEQTTQWPKEKVQKDKRSTKHTYKTKDRVTRTPLKIM